MSKERRNLKDAAGIITCVDRKLLQKTTRSPPLIEYFRHEPQDENKKKVAVWLCDPHQDPNENKIKQMPEVLLSLQQKGVLSDFDARP